MTGAPEPGKVYIEICSYCLLQYLYQFLLCTVFYIHIMSHNTNISLRVCVCVSYFIKASINISFAPRASVWVPILDLQALRESGEWSPIKYDRLISSASFSFIALTFALLLIPTCGEETFMRQWHL